MGASGGPKIVNSNLKMLLDPKDEVCNDGGAFIRDLSGNLNTKPPTENTAFDSPRSGSLYSGRALQQISASTHYVDCGLNIGNHLGDDYPGSLTFTGWIQDDRPLGAGGFGEGQVLASLINIGHKDDSEHGRFMCSLASSIEHSTQKMTMMVGNNTKNISCDWPNDTRGKWKHVAYVYTVNDSATTSFTTTDGSGCQIYIDGIEQNPTAPAGSFPATNTMDMSGRNTSFGAYFASNGGGNYNINGLIADFRLYNTALSKTQVKDIYLKGTACPTGISGSNLLGWWPMSDNSNGFNSSIDNCSFLSGGSGSLKNSPTFVSMSSDVPQTINRDHSKKLNFGMSSGFVRVPNSDDINAGTSDFSIMVWWNGKTEDGGAPIMMFNAYPKGYRIVDGATGNYRFSMFEQWFVSDEYASLDIPKISDKWNCLIISADRDGDVNCYVNGINRASTDISFMQGDISEDGQDMYIGSVLPTLAQDRANGIIDEIAFWKSALSVAEVQSLYQTGSDGFPNPPDATTIGSNLKMYLRNQGASGSWTDLSGNGNHGYVSQSASGPNQAYIPKGIEPDKDANGFFINKSNDGWFDFTASGSEQTPDGAVSYATHGDVDTSTNATTMEAWYRPKRLSLAENYSIMWKPHDEPNYGYWPTMALQISAGKVRMAHSATTYGHFLGYRDTSAVVIDTVDQWYHIAVTKPADGGNNDGTPDVKIYVNGSFESSSITFTYGSSNPTQLGDVNTPIYIGAAVDNSNFPQLHGGIHGDLTSIKVYDRDLTDKEILQNYNAGKQRFK